jgi:predicted RNA-binding Zn-ribbon protein involved in translation (DUF1610 family)
MKAKFDFSPAYCPNCGKRLFDPGKAEYLTSLRAELEDYHNGHEFACDCGLRFIKADFRAEIITKTPPYVDAP